MARLGYARSLTSYSSYLASSKTRTAISELETATNDTCPRLPGPRALMPALPAMSDGECLLAPCCEYTRLSPSRETMSEDRPIESRVTFRRRRRKRRLQTSGGGEGTRHVLAAVDGAGNKRRSEREITKFDEQDFDTNEMQKHQSIPEMLYMRATGRILVGSRDFPLGRTLASGNGSKLGKRSIRFSQLKSSNSEAVLALEHSGSYFVSLAGNTAAFTLALCLYAVPSPSWMENERQERDQSIVSPLVTTIPLSLPSDDDTSDRYVNCHVLVSTLSLLVLYHDASFCFTPLETFAVHCSGSVATTPVRVAVSRDWSIGMAFVNHLSQSSNFLQEDPLGDMILFSLSTRGDAVQTFKCANVRIAGSTAYTMRNLLWKTKCIPHGESKSTCLCDNVLNLPGYLLLNDEEDGFRLTWAVASAWLDLKANHVGLLTPSSLSVVPSRSDIITNTDEVVWEEYWSDRYSGRPTLASQNDSSTLHIAFEAYFRVDALLHDILARRREKFNYQENALPDFHYNLISIDDDGRTAILVIVFGRNQTAASSRRISVGVFIQIDLFTQSYKEVGWVQNRVEPTDSLLRRWSNALAINRRMKEQHVGPFSRPLTTSKALDGIDFSMFYQDSNHDFSEWEKQDDESWDRYLYDTENGLRSADASHSTADSPKHVTGTVLFPNCDIITNNAVRSVRPVSFIRCRSMTTELIYG